jgi:hypothetical protein
MQILPHIYVLNQLINQQNCHQQLTSIIYINLPPSVRQYKSFWHFYAY